MCWSPGIVGTLTNRQDEEYCPVKTIEPATAKVGKRIKLLKALMGCLDEEDFLKCVEAKAHEAV